MTASEREWCALHPASHEISDALRQRVAWIARVARAEVVVAHDWLMVVGDADRVIALASSTTTLLLRDGVAPETAHPAALHRAADSHSLNGFTSINPWPQDTTFLRGDTLLKEAVERASA